MNEEEKTAMREEEAAQKAEGEGGGEEGKNERRRRKRLDQASAKGWVVKAVREEWPESSREATRRRPDE